MTSPQPFSFTRQGRSAATIVAVALTWAFCLIGYLVFDVMPWILFGALLLTLPALWDVYARTEAGVRLDPETLHWFSGKAAVSVPVSEINHVRLVTRLDMSVRAVVVLHSGRKLRLPVEATPADQDFETALNAFGISTQRHHFTRL